MGNVVATKCVPCRGDVPPVTDDEIAKHRSPVPDWKIVERTGVKQLERLYARYL